MKDNELVKLKSEIESLINSKSKENKQDDVMLSRIRDLAQSTLNLRDTQNWDQHVAQALISHQSESINFLKV